LLLKSLQKLASLKSLAYSVEYEFQIPDPRTAPAQIEGDDVRLEAPPIAVDGTTPQLRQRAVATVTWQRLPAAEESAEPRARFRIQGQVHDLGPVPRGEPGDRRDPADPPANRDAAPRPTTAPAGRNAAATPLQMHFNGTLLRTLLERQEQVLEYDSIDGEVPVSALGLFLPLLDIGFLPGAVTPESEPEGTEVVALPPARVDEQPCHVLEVRIPVYALDPQGQPDPDALAPEPGRERGPALRQVRRLYLAEGDLLPRRVMVFPLSVSPQPAVGGEANPDAPVPPVPPGIAPGMRGREVEASPPTVVTLRELQPDVATDPADFELPVPEGYELREVVDSLVSNLQTGDSLPDFEWQSAKGQPVGWRDVSADLVLLAFWATWDRPNCRITLELMQELHEEFGDRGLAVTGVSLDADDEEITSAKQYIAKRKWTYRMFFNASDFAEDIGLQSLPHVILLDSQGRVLYQHTGDEPKTEKRLRRAIESRLKPAAAKP